MFYFCVMKKIYIVSFFKANYYPIDHQRSLLFSPSRKYFIASVKSLFFVNVQIKHIYKTINLHDREDVYYIFVMMENEICWINTITEQITLCSANIMPENNQIKIPILLPVCYILKEIVAMTITNDRKLF